MFFVKPQGTITFVANSLIQYMVYLTRVEHFNAAHKLYNPDWNETENKEVFGKCSNTNWHGHNYELHVTIKGKPSPETGFIFNAKTLGVLIKDVVIEKVDHKNLNLDVDFMKGVFTSAENLAIGIWNELFPHLEALGAQLHSIRLYETKSIYVEYLGE
jgi:6-pyruvoyltetrahydropterin/6-carboxytetrahydropterin synthase